MESLKLSWSWGLSPVSTPPSSLWPLSWEAMLPVRSLIIWSSVLSVSSYSLFAWTLFFSSSANLINYDVLLFVSLPFRSYSSTFYQDSHFAIQLSMWALLWVASEKQYNWKCACSRLNLGRQVRAWWNSSLCPSAVMKVKDSGSR